MAEQYDDNVVVLLGPEDFDRWCSCNYMRWFFEWCSRCFFRCLGYCNINNNFNNFNNPFASLRRCAYACFFNPMNNNSTILCTYLQYLIFVPVNVVFLATTLILEVNKWNDLNSDPDSLDSDICFQSFIWNVVDLIWNILVVFITFAFCSIADNDVVAHTIRILKWLSLNVVITMIKSAVYVILYSTNVFQHCDLSRGLLHLMIFNLILSTLTFSAFMKKIINYIYLRRQHHDLSPVFDIEVALISIPPNPLFISEQRKQNIRQNLIVNASWNSSNGDGSELKNLNETSQNPICSICIQPLEVTSPNYQVRNCGHFFDRDCLDRWIELGKLTCPNCRGPLSTTISDLDDVV